MKLQKIVRRLQKLHPKEIDLSLNRIKKLLNKIGNPQNKIKAISIVGTNGKYSTIEAIFSILKASGYICNIYTSPHIQNINERFVFNNKKLTDRELVRLLEFIENSNKNEEITFFEILTAAYFYKAAKYPENINLIESGLFHRFDATNVLNKNIASVITSISKDHLDWLPRNKKTLERIVFEKTSKLISSDIIVSKQRLVKTSSYIQNNIKKKKSNNYFFDRDFTYKIKDNNSFYYKDKFGLIDLPMPNILGQFQLENITTAIASLRLTKKFKIKENNIKKALTKINSLGRLQEIKSGKLKKLVKDNKLIVDGSHNEDGSRVLNEYLKSLNCRKHIVLGMMANKDHSNFIKYFKNISSITTIDIPNQPNSLDGKILKTKFKNFQNVKYKPTIKKAISSVNLRKGDLLLITGSLYLAGEVLNLN
tara:strand:- start:562 stop:1830 length:1269 start_codon:yes stop_codon:yes gene_type:complete